MGPCNPPLWLLEIVSGLIEVDESVKKAIGLPPRSIQTCAAHSPRDTALSAESDDLSSFPDAGSVFRLGKRCCAVGRGRRRSQGR